MLRNRKHAMTPLGVGWTGVVAAMVCLQAFAADDVTVHLPAWGEAGRPIEGTIETDAPLDIVTCTYRMPDGTRGEAEATWDSTAGCYTFVIPPGNSEGDLTVTVHAENGRTEIAETCTLPLGTGTPIAFEGEPYQTLSKRVDDNPHLRGVTLTLVQRLDRGELRIVHLPRRPDGPDEGLPIPTVSTSKETQSELGAFAVVLDDATQAAAGALSILAIVPEDRASEALTAYRLVGGRWRPVPGAVSLSGGSAVRVPCLEGGLYIIAPRCRANPR